MKPFSVFFGEDKVCQENLQCVGKGVAACAAPATNILTDTKIADFITCAGQKCQHPSPPHHKNCSAVENSWSAAPSNTAEQLLCMASKCGDKALKILGDQDNKDLLTCMTHDDLPDLCPSVWNCLGDKACTQALSCWSKPFKTCSSDMWHVLTDADQRKRIEHTVSCIEECGHDHSDDFVDATFCVMDKCGEAVLDCNKDDVCREAVKCVPNTVGQCVLPQLESYIQQELFNNATKCMGRGLELCGAATVEMLRNDDVAAAVTCNAQCTIKPQVVSVV